MPRTKKTEAEALVPAEPKTRRTVTKKATAVTHKHTTKKNLAPVAQVPVQTVKEDAIAQLAYSYWESRGCQHGSPQEDWLRAEQELKVRAATA